MENLDKPDEIIPDKPIKETTPVDKEIELDMNNLDADCESPIVKCTTEGCVTQC